VIPNAALVTGASAGIGLAFVERLARDGSDVILVSRTEERLREIADRMTATHGVSAEVLPADLSNRNDLARVEERLADPDRPVDLLINNAGFGLNASFLGSSLDDQTYYLDVLVTAVLRLTQVAGRAMADRGDGGIINVSSVAAFAPLNVYSAHKAWVTTFSQGVAAELGPRGVQVMSLNPGFTRTEFHQRADMSTSDIPGFMWLEADAVVDAALKDLARGRDLSIPDARYKGLTALMRHMPTGLVGRIGRGMRSRQ
jgi:uncharacterized protein